jgi:hypothetical protein
MPRQQRTEDDERQTAINDPMGAAIDRKPVEDLGRRDG